MNLAERFWWLLTIVAISWYLTVTIYVAIRGAFDIQPVRPGVTLDDLEQFGGKRLELIVCFLPDSGEESFDRFADGVFTGHNDRRPL